MITFYAFYSLFALLAVMFSILPQVSTLPFGLDDTMVQVVGYFNAISSLVPWLGVMFTAMLFYLNFRVVLMVAKVLRLFRI